MSEINQTKVTAVQDGRGSNYEKPEIELYEVTNNPSGLKTV